MTLKDIDQLRAEIDAAVHTDGPLGKTTAVGLSALLKSLAAEIVAQQQAAEQVTTRKADLDASGRVPVEQLPQTNKLYPAAGQATDGALTQKAASDADAAITAAVVAEGQTRTQALLGKADLVGGVVPAGQLPSYVDDVLAFPTRDSFPTAGEAGKIYLANDDLDGQWRWSGGQYRRFNSSPGSSDAVAEGSSNRYFTDERVRQVLAQGFNNLGNFTSVNGRLNVAGGVYSEGEVNTTRLNIIDPSNKLKQAGYITGSGLDINGFQAYTTRQEDATTKNRLVVTRLTLVEGNVALVAAREYNYESGVKTGVPTLSFAGANLTLMHEAENFEEVSPYAVITKQYLVSYVARQLQQGSHGPAAGVLSLETPAGGRAAPVAVCVANGSNSGHPSTQFATITLNNVILDQKPTGSTGGFDATTGEYVAPVSGTYQVTSKLRITDNAVGPNQSYGQGTGSVNEDGSWFQWFAGTGSAPTNRNGSLNVRLLHLNAGERLRMYAYFDGFSAAYGAELNIVLLAADA